MPFRLHLLAFGVALGLSACASVPIAKSGSTAPTALTLNSGGVMPAEQARVHFDHAELHFTVDAARQSIDASATLSFTAKSAIDSLLLDLDRNLPISAIELDGQTLAASAWHNPDGRLRIQLPTALAAGGKVSVTVRYGGKPHVAKNAPWDGGFVWSHTADGQPWVASAVQGEGCDLFWPCIDQPQGEPDLVDTYVTVPKALAAPGNGVLIGITEEGDRHTYHWRIKQPDTYAIAINIGPFKLLKADYASRYGNTIPMELWYLPEHEARRQGTVRRVPAHAGFLRAADRPVSLRRRKDGRGGNPAHGHGAPDPQRLRQRLSAEASTASTACCSTSLRTSGSATS